MPSAAAKAGSSETRRIFFGVVCEDLACLENYAVIDLDCLDDRGVRLAARTVFIAFNQSAEVHNHTPLKLFKNKKMLLSLKTKGQETSPAVPPLFADNFRALFGYSALTFIALPL